MRSSLAFQPNSHLWPRGRKSNPNPAPGSRSQSVPTDFCFPGAAFIWVVAAVQLLQLSGMSRLPKFPRRPKPEPARRTSVSHRWRRLALAVLGIVVVFALGFYAGKYGIPSRHIVSGDAGRPIDLTNFYQSKKLIESRYPGNVDEGKLATGASKGLVSGLGDPYSVYLAKDEAKELQTTLAGKVEGIGIEVGLRNDQVTVIAPIAGSPAERAGIKPGDVIASVGGKPTVGQTVDEVANKIRGPKGSQVTLEVKTPGQPQPRQLTLTREEITSPSVRVKYQGDVAIITVSSFDQNTKAQLDQAVTDVQAKHPRGIVLDLRGNPGGYLDGAVDVSGVFLKSGTVVKEKFKDKTEERSVSNDGRLAGYPLVVLVDKGSASASEIVAGALRDDRGVPLVGEKTYGKGSVQELIDLDAGDVLKLTIAEWLTPKGISISKNGLAPDVESSSDNPDAQLQAAIGRLAP